jgi:hypothetical protein
MAGMLRVPRSRGALSGVLLVLLGAWGALIPFIGPYFHYAYTPDRAWTYNTGRLWLEVLPGAAVLLGGLIALVASTRPTALFGAWLATLGGAWFVVGRPLSTLWTTGSVVAAGHPVGGTVTSAAENIGFFTGLGVVVLFFAAMALGRFTVIGVREAGIAADAGPADTGPADTGPADTGPVRDAAPAGTLPVRDTVPASGLPRRTPVTTDGTESAAARPVTRWRPFARHAADSPPTAGTAPVATADRPAGKHSAESSNPPA